MEQQFPKIGGPENRAQKSFQNWTYLLAERKEVFSLFYMLGSQIMTPKWAQNWDPKNGFKTAPATHSCKFHGAKATTKAHTHTHTHTQTHICRTEEQELQSWSGKNFSQISSLKTHCCSRNQQQQGQQFTGCEHTDHLHKRFYFSSTRQLSLQACCLCGQKWSSNSLKLGGPKTGPKKASKIGPTCWQKERRSFHCFTCLGPKL